MVPAACLHSKVTQTIHCVVELDDGRVASGSRAKGGDKLTLHLQGHAQLVTCSEDWCECGPEASSEEEN